MIVNMLPVGTTPPMISSYVKTMVCPLVPGIVMPIRLGAVTSAGCVELFVNGTPLAACRLSLPLPYV